MCHLNNTSGKCCLLLHSAVFFCIFFINLTLPKKKSLSLFDSCEVLQISTNVHSVMLQFSKPKSSIPKHQGQIFCYFYLCQHLDFRPLSYWGVIILTPNMPACPSSYLKVTMFFLTVYLKYWEYSQSLLSEETLSNNSCESPLLPPSPFSSSLFLFLIFVFSCFGI